MAELQTQYENFLTENPESNLTFEEWYSLISEPKFRPRIKEMKFQDFTDIENPGVSTYED